MQKIPITKIILKSNNATRKAYTYASRANNSSTNIIFFLSLSYNLHTHTQWHPPSLEPTT